jgi:hypothetical protein
MRSPFFPYYRAHGPFARQNKEALTFDRSKPPRVRRDLRSRVLVEKHSGNDEMNIVVMRPLPQAGDPETVQERGIVVRRAAPGREFSLAHRPGALNSSGRASLH